MKLNKGEWSEVYVFLKLLAEGKLYAADKDLEKISDIYYSVLAVIRNDTARYFEHKNGLVSVRDEIGNLYQEYDKRTFEGYAISLLNTIISNTGPSFGVKTVTDFMGEIGLTNLKAKSQDKKDIILKVHDAVVCSERVLGFSIKSNLGSSPTLFNSSKSTN